MEKIRRVVEAHINDTPVELLENSAPTLDDIRRYVQLPKARILYYLRIMEDERIIIGRNHPARKRVYLPTKIGIEYSE